MPGLRYCRFCRSWRGSSWGFASSPLLCSRCLKKITFSRPRCGMVSRDYKLEFWEFPPLFYAFKYFCESVKTIIAFSGVLQPSFAGGAVGLTWISSWSLSQMVMFNQFLTWKTEQLSTGNEFDGISANSGSLSATGIMLGWHKRHLSSSPNFFSSSEVSLICYREISIISLWRCCLIWPLPLGFFLREFWLPFWVF